MQMTDSPNTSRGQMIAQMAQLAQRRQAQQPMSYVSPSQREAAIRSGGGDVSASAQKYALQRLGQFEQVANQVGGQFQGLFPHSDMNYTDPSQSYRQASALFSQFAKQQGVNDPRQLLLQMLQHAQAADGRTGQLLGAGAAAGLGAGVGGAAPAQMASLRAQTNTSPSAAVGGVAGGGGSPSAYMGGGVMSPIIAALVRRQVGGPVLGSTGLSYGSPSALYGANSYGSPSALYGG